MEEKFVKNYETWNFEFLFKQNWRPRSTEESDCVNRVKNLFWQTEVYVASSFSVFIADIFMQ